METSLLVLFGHSFLCLVKNNPGNSQLARFSTRGLKKIRDGKTNIQVAF